MERSIRWMGRTAVAALAVLGVGCAHQLQKVPPPPPSGDATWHRLEATDMTHYRLAIGEVSSGGTPFQRVTPAYPPGPLAACPAPVEVHALLVVDAAGKVTEVRPADPAAVVPGSVPFLDAVRSAAMQWQFNPLQINHWSADANGDSHVVDSKTLPFSQVYAFVFTCHAGKAQVSAGNAVAVGRRD